MTNDKGKGTTGAPGQQKVYEVTNKETGEVRVVTQAEWREGKLGQAGFTKPDDMPEEAPPAAGDSGE